MRQATLRKPTSWCNLWSGPACGSARRRDPPTCTCGRRPPLDHPTVAALDRSIRSRARRHATWNPARPGIWNGAPSGPETFAQRRRRCLPGPCPAPQPLSPSHTRKGPRADFRTIKKNVGIPPPPPPLWPNANMSCCRVGCKIDVVSLIIERMAPRPESHVNLSCRLGGSCQPLVRVRGRTCPPLVLEKTKHVMLSCWLGKFHPKKKRCEFGPALPPQESTIPGRQPRKAWPHWNRLEDQTEHQESAWESPPVHSQPTKTRAPSDARKTGALGARRPAPLRHKSPADTHKPNVSEKRRMSALFLLS